MFRGADNGGRGGVEYSSEWGNLECYSLITERLPCCNCTVFEVLRNCTVRQGVTKELDPEMMGIHSGH